MGMLMTAHVDDDKTMMWRLDGDEMFILNGLDHLLKKKNIKIILKSETYETQRFIFSFFIKNVLNRQKTVRFILFPTILRKSAPPQ